MDETNRRRAEQQRYNEENDITPQSIIKPLDPELVRIYEGDYYEMPAIAEEINNTIPPRNWSGNSAPGEGDARGGEGIRIRKSRRASRSGQETEKNSDGFPGSNPGS